MIPVFSLSELHDCIDMKQFYYMKIQSTYEFVPSPLLKPLSCLFIYVRERCIVLTVKTASKKLFSQVKVSLNGYLFGKTLALSRVLLVFSLQPKLFLCRGWAMDKFQPNRILIPRFLLVGFYCMLITRCIMVYSV